MAHQIGFMADHSEKQNDIIAPAQVSIQAPRRSLVQVSFSNGQKLTYWLCIDIIIEFCLK